jgi:hypothetical protein
VLQTSSKNPARPPTATRVTTTTTATETTDPNTADRLTPVRRAAASVLLATALTLAGAWFAWRIVSLGAHPLRVVMLVVEISGWVAGVFVAHGLLAANSPRPTGAGASDNTDRYAAAVAGTVGRTRATDLHRDLRVVFEHVAARSRRQGSDRADRADRAIAGVLADGPRRLAMVAIVSTSLLIGVSPMPVPPLWALAAVLAATVLMASAHVVASRGRVRFGDRTRWSYAAVGEVVSPADRAEVAPRRWVGTVATVVVVNLAVALRGTSDRWTHGLPAMTDDERLVAMVWASVLVVGGLYTLRTIPAPRLGNEHLVARRLEERGARRSALGAAVCLGVVGLFAGVLPGGVDTGPDDPLRVETPAQIEADGGAGG